MAEIVGVLASSHAPQLMLDPDRWHLLNNPYMGILDPDLQNVPHQVKWERWNRCMAAIQELRQHLDRWAPDTVVVVGDDQHENMLEDNMPPFTLFIGEEAEASVSLRYLQESPEENRSRYRADGPLGRWVIDYLMDSGFDPSYSMRTSHSGGLGHAFGRVLKWLNPDGRYSILPIMVNTYFPPAPSPKRCVQFGRALASAIEGFPESRRVVLVGSGGLSHTKIDVQLDREFLHAIVENDTPYLESMRPHDLVDGTSEIRNWIVVAAAADRPATIVDYQPLPRVPTGGGCGMGFATWE